MTHGVLDVICHGFAFTAGFTRVERGKGKNGGEGGVETNAHGGTEGTHASSTHGTHAWLGCLLQPFKLVVDSRKFRKRTLLKTRDKPEIVSCTSSQYLGWLLMGPHPRNTSVSVPYASLMSYTKFVMALTYSALVTGLECVAR